MRKSGRRCAVGQVGKMCKSGGEKANITAKRLTTPVWFLTVQTVENRLQNGTIEQPYNAWNLLKPEQSAKERVNSGDKSKSIFREIERKYWANFRKFSIITIESNHDFTQRLTKQLNYKRVNLRKLQKSINNEIVKIDQSHYRYCNTNCLRIVKMATSASVSSSDSNKTRKRQICDNSDTSLGGASGGGGGGNKENVPLKFPFIPSTNWVYSTPPNRKLNFNNLLKQQQFDMLNDNTIQPAVVRTCNDKTIVYEMNKRINIDFNQFDNQQEIDIDRRYMMEVTNVHHNRGQRLESKEQHVFRFNGNNADDDDDGGGVAGGLDNGENVVEQLEIPSSDPYELEHHFLSLTCRPKKTLSTVSRIPNVKRKRDMFLTTSTSSTSASGSLAIKQTKFQDFTTNNNNNNNKDNDDVDSDIEFESGFSVINPDLLEKSFTFKFTPTTSGKFGINNGNGRTVAGRLFDSDGNEKDCFTFDCDME